MIKIDGKTIKMNEGDYGEIITFNLTSGNILPTDDITFIIENEKNKEQILTKKVDIINQNTFELTFTQNESNQLKINKYLWGILWKRDGELIDTLQINNYLVVERGLNNGD